MRKFLRSIIILVLLSFSFVISSNVVEASPTNGQHVGVKSDLKQFKNQELLDVHFVKHGQGVQRVLHKCSYTVTDYLRDANHIIDTGQYVPELNGYVKLIGGTGKAKYGFVGLDRSTGRITTFHIKYAKQLAKKAPSLGLKIGD